MEFMSIPDLTAYLKLPEDYPITKVKFTYKDMPNKNVAFLPKPIKWTVMDKLDQKECNEEREDIGALKAS